MPPKPAFQFTLRSLLAEMLLAAAALGLVRWLFLLERNWAIIAGLLVINVWLIGSLWILCRDLRVVTAWGAVVSSTFLIVGGPHAAGTIFMYVWWEFEFDWLAWCRGSIALVPLAALLFAGTYVAGRKLWGAALGLMAVACLLAFLNRTLNLRDLAPFKLVSAAPLVMCLAARVVLDLQALRAHPAPATAPESQDRGRSSGKETR